VMGCWKAQRGFAGAEHYSSIFPVTQRARVASAAGRAVHHVLQSVADINDTFVLSAIYLTLGPCWPRPVISKFTAREPLPRSNDQAARAIKVNG